MDQCFDCGRSDQETQLCYFLTGSGQKVKGCLCGRCLKERGY